MTAENLRRRRQQDQEHVSSDSDKGERRARGDGQEERANASKEWRSKSAENLAGSETEEDMMTAFWPEGEKEMRTMTPWGTQESDEGALNGDAQAGGGNTRKAPSAAANKARAQGYYGARPEQKGKKGGQRENKGGKTSGVLGDDMGHGASGVAHESPGVGDEEGGSKAFGVAGNQRGSCHRVGGGVESP